MTSSLSKVADRIVAWIAQLHNEHMGAGQCTDALCNIPKARANGNHTTWLAVPRADSCRSWHYTWPAWPNGEAARSEGNQ